MKKSISTKEQKRILVKMLNYFDLICRNNNIKYSLIGGSLIGAVRHHGFIPWDDDIDVILDRENYERLIEVLKENKSNIYKALIPGETQKYPLHFMKIVDTRTELVEECLAQKINNYGVFIDVFCYSYVSDDIYESKKYYEKFSRLRKSLVKTKINYQKPGLKKKIGRIAKNIYITIFGYKKQLKMILKIFNDNKELKTNHIMSNNPVYRFEKEYQSAKALDGYIDAEFEGIKVMIFKEYDNVLRTTFGDYMKLPPESERIQKHGIKAWWKDGSKK